MSKKEDVRAWCEPMLDKPGIALPETGPVSSFCFYVIALSLAGTGATGCFFTAFQIPIDPLPVFLVGAACVLLCSAQFLLGRWKWLLTLIPLAIWGLALWWNFEDVAQGCFRVINYMVTAYGEKLNFPLSAIPTPFAGPGRARKLASLFAVFLQFPFFKLLFWLLIRHKSALGAFGLTGIFLLLPMAISVLPEFWALGLLFLFWAFLLFIAPSLRQRHQLVDGKGRFQAVGDLFAQPAALLLLPVLGLCIFAIYRAYPPETYERPAFINDVRAELAEEINLPAMLRGGTGSGGNRVDLSALGERSYAGKTALRVKFDWKTPLALRVNSPTSQKDYLKSFVGSVYTGNSWERLSQEDAALARDALGEGKSSQTLYSDLSVSLSCPDDYKSAYLLSVKKIDVDSRSVYAPYGLYSPGGAPQDMEYADDGFLRFSRLLSSPTEYTLSATALPSEGIFLMERFAFPFQEYLEARDKINTLTGEGQTGKESLDRITAEMADYREEQKDENGRLPHSAYDLWKVPDWAQDLFLDQNAKNVINETQRYSQFVYDHYTQLPEDTLGFARGYLEKYHILDGSALAEKYISGLESGGALTIHPDAPSEMRVIVGSDGRAYLDSRFREEYVELIREHLASVCSYTLSPPALPEGRDFVEYFLTESHEGYCVHFASAAVVLLRALGIPARYAEGYAVPVQEGGEWANVPDYNAHAWVEVYWSGAGWLPMEMTPAVPDAPAAYANATAPGPEDSPLPTPFASPTPGPVESSPAPSPSPTAAPTPAGSTPTAAPSPEAAGTGESDGGVDWRLVLRVLLILLIIPGLLFLLGAQRKIRVSCRERAFRQPDRNQAALRVYAHLLRLYEVRLFLSDEEGPPAEITELALKARFSNHTLTQEELQKLTKLADGLEKELERELPKLQRLRCKYLLALF